MWKSEFLISFVRFWIADGRSFNSGSTSFPSLSKFSIETWKCSFSAHSSIALFVRPFSQSTSKVLLPNFCLLALFLKNAWLGTTNSRSTPPGLFLVLWRSFDFVFVAQPIREHNNLKQRFQSTPQVIVIISHPDDLSNSFHLHQTSWSVTKYILNLVQTCEESLVSCFRHFPICGNPELPFSASSKKLRILTYTSSLIYEKNDKLDNSLSLRCINFFSLPTSSNLNYSQTQRQWFLLLPLIQSLKPIKVREGEREDTIWSNPSLLVKRKRQLVFFCFRWKAIPSSIISFFPPIPISIRWSCFDQKTLVDCEILKDLVEFVFYPLPLIFKKPKNKKKNWIRWSGSKSLFGSCERILRPTWGKIIPLQAPFDRLLEFWWKTWKTCLRARWSHKM